MRPAEVVSTLGLWLVGVLLGILLNPVLGLVVVLAACGWGLYRTRVWPGAPRREDDAP